MTRSDWIEHRRPDGELVGWLEPEEDGFHVVDLLGRRRTSAAVDYAEAVPAPAELRSLDAASLPRDLLP